MKFLIIQENGRHDKNRLFRECFSAQKSLITLGHLCEVWGKGHQNFNLPINFNDYDIIIDLENYNTGWVPNLSKVKAYKVMWAIDAHCRGIDHYRNQFKRGNYNLILQATKDFVDNQSIWFPNCFDENLIYPIDVEKRADVGFCGNKLNRQPYFDLLSQNFNFISDIFVIGQDMVRAINSYKVHFNANLSIDINYRSFETIGCKILLATNYNYQYEELGFKDGENCIMYKNKKELIDKISLALGNEKHLLKMAENGFILSKQNTYLNRMKYLEDILSEKIKG